jgi:hypothetical protein
MREFGIPRFRLPDMPLYRPEEHLSDNILAFRDVLESDKCLEIHCIDSSFYHLVESLQPKARLFFHRYARRNFIACVNDYLMKHIWSILA